MLDYLETSWRVPGEFSLFTLSKPMLQENMEVVYKHWVNSGKITDMKRLG